MRRLVVSLALASTYTVGTVLPAAAVDDVTICHATGLQNDPYVVNTPTPQSTYDGHYLLHTGAVWTSSASSWGDIIPPFEYNAQIYSLNWPAGQAIFENGCKPAGPSSVFEDWADISSGASHSCGVRRNGKLYCWGSDTLGQIGDGQSLPPSKYPRTVPRRIGSFEDWATVSAGTQHTCGTRKNGKLYCWGYNVYGQIGDGASGSSTPVDAPKRIGTFEDWTRASAGASHTCAVRTNGKLYCWGHDANGQIGDDDHPTPAIAPRRIGTFEDWSNVVAADFHTCGIRRNGKLYCWGSDTYGKLGNGSPSGDVNAPARIGSFEDWASVSGGRFHTCGVRANRKLYCWGHDTQGQIGNGPDSSVDVLAPGRIGTFEDWARVSAGEQHTCGVRSNGKLYCWGYDNLGQVGDGGTTPTATAPRRIGETYSDWATSDAGTAHSCGIRAHKLYCWGSDSTGQIGNGPFMSSTTTPQRL